MKKKGVSPIIATVLLIALVIIIGTIVFMWFRSMTQEAITKFEGENIELTCEKVQFEKSYSITSKILTIYNTGNIPIYNMNVKMEGGGSYETKEITDPTLFGDSWPEKGLNTGAVAFRVISANSYETITLIPILMGTNEEGIKKTHVCDERYGEIIYL